MLPDIMHILLVSMNVKLYSWTLTFRKVVQQQIWGEAVVLIQASSTDPLLSLAVKKITTIGLLLLTLSWK